MAQNDSGAAAVEEQAEFTYPVTVENISTVARKVSVEIPAERIQSKLSEQFDELRQQAAIPGFRAGHAPRKLIEKRFEKDVRDQVRRTLISESYEQAIEKNKLEVIGEPEFENPDEVELPQSGPLTYSFQVEIQPEITLPSLENLRVKKPRVAISDTEVDLALKNLSEQQGTLVPVEDRGVQEGDYLTANVHVKHNDELITHQHDARLVARAGRVAGIQIDDLATQLQGAKSGETKTLTVKAPSTHPTEAIRDQDVQIEIELLDIKHLQPATIDKDFLDRFGFESEQELRSEMQKELENRVAADSRQALRQQVHNYLLQNVNIELPDKISQKQVELTERRHRLSAYMRGLSDEEVEKNVEQLKAEAQKEAVRELKLFFIMQKVAQEQNIDVDESELNGRVALIAAQRERRPEKLKAEMAKDGSLTNLYIQIREEKAIDKILEKATIEEVDLKELSQEQVAEVTGTNEPSAADTNEPKAE